MSVKGKFYVGDSFRTNPLSLTNGGHDVEIYFKDKPSRVYSNVKSPFSFWKKARNEDSSIKGYRVLVKCGGKTTTTIR